MSAHETRSPRPAPSPEPLWRHVVGDVLRRRRRAQGRTLQDVADVAGISMPYLSEMERGRKEASSEMLAAVAGALGLGLFDVLALAQGELARAVQVRSTVSVTAVGSLAARGTGVARGRGTVCLAA
ncbi:helix-turn-helix domain-containing protein [Streptomyces sp. SID8379]|uniref:helix-turn-helix domain-containing protein n=1 Tax=unclassified Streptomyces TaxID=2593676 RepID=UPI00039ECB0D|nr:MULTISPECIES: helix-turn-helix transcriptional regulator [unclassified Streptomyces]MYW66875.1 helix-turn-helix domain-containing protein [Streptomyces sp. SID8379]